jgi:hypothetical protein
MTSKVMDKTLICILGMLSSIVSSQTGLLSEIFMVMLWIIWDGDNVVGIATLYGLEGPGIESRWGRDFPPIQTGPGAHPASCIISTGFFFIFVVPCIINLFY